MSKEQQERQLLPRRPSMFAKLKSALDARVDGDLMIVARTDARAIEGLEAAVERAQLYRAVGADMIFVEAPLSTDEMAYVCSDIAAPCLANNVEGGKTPILPAARLQEIGYAAVAFPVSASYVAARALRAFFASGSMRSGWNASGFGKYFDCRWIARMYIVMIERGGKR